MTAPMTPTPPERKQNLMGHDLLLGVPVSLSVQP